MESINKKPSRAIALLLGILAALGIAFGGQLAAPVFNIATGSTVVAEASADAKPADPCNRPQSLACKRAQGIDARANGDDSSLPSEPWNVNPETAPPVGAWDDSNNNGRSDSYLHIEDGTGGRTYERTG